MSDFRIYSEIIYHTEDKSQYSNEVSTPGRIKQQTYCVPILGWYIHSSVLSMTHLCNYLHNYGYLHKTVRDWVLEHSIVGV